MTVKTLLMFALYTAAALTLLRIGNYGFTMFALMPLLAGAFAAWAFRPKTALRAAGSGALTLLGCTFCLLAAGREGLMCVLMALPLALPLGALGGFLAYFAAHSEIRARTAALLLFLPPATLTWDAVAPSPIFPVHTQITVAATPEQVWKHVVSFSQLPEPREWYFQYRPRLAHPRAHRGFRPRGHPLLRVLHRPVRRAHRRLG